MLLDEFYWLIALWCNRWALLGFSGQPKTDKNLFWVSCIGRPISRLIFVRFSTGKKQCLSQAVYFHISTKNVWLNYPFEKKTIFEDCLIFLRLIVDTYSWVHRHVFSTIFNNFNHIFIQLYKFRNRMKYKSTPMNIHLTYTQNYVLYCSVVVITSKPMWKSMTVNCKMIPATMVSSKNSQKISRNHFSRSIGIQISKNHFLLVAVVYFKRDFAISWNPYKRKKVPPSLDPPMGWNLSHRVVTITCLVHIFETIHAD